MAFLDNSGDIILDAVLTDTGRYRLAKGDGSFRVAKFALGDDEINYRLYDKNNTSGSAYYDLSILQTPVLEAFTDNAAGLKSKLMTISRNNLLYLPVLKLNETNNVTKRYTDGSFMVAVDEDTEDAMITSTTTGDTVVGVLKGLTVNESKNHIQIDQGLDTNYEISPTNALDADLVETQYIIEMDNRLGNIIAPQQNGSTVARASYIDDDNIASYFFSLGSDTSFVKEINNLTNTAGNGQVITGPRGTKLEFSIRSSIDLQTTTFLFDQLGGTTVISAATGTPTVQYIDTNVRVIGATTGYRVDIPVRFIKV
jgi:hypothetical protein